MIKKAFVNIIKHGGSALASVCDDQLLGKTLKFGKIDFKIEEGFYGGSSVELSDVMELIREARIVNLIGSDVIEMAIKKGILHPKGILYISGVPHAQIVRF